MQCTGAILTPLEYFKYTVEGCVDAFSPRVISGKACVENIGGTQIKNAINDTKIHFLKITAYVFSVNFQSEYTCDDARVGALKEKRPKT